VRDFESRWASWLGTDHAVYVNSGSSANLLMYYAALLSGRLANRKVVVPAVSWATTVAPAVQLGFEPIMCDADRDTWGIDLDQLDRICREHAPAAVIVVHTMGVPNKMRELLELRERHGFLLMEDTCAGTGSTYDGRKIGTFGDLSSFSFYFGHHLSTIEGGMVCTPHADLHEILLHTRSHGWAKDLSAERQEELARAKEPLPFNRIFTFYHPGFNFRSTDLNARLGLRQLKKADGVVARRVANHRAYQARFLDDPAFTCQTNDRAVISSISFAALAASGEHRDRVGAALVANGIETRPLGGGSMARQPFWRERYGASELPVADAVHERSFMLPNHQALTETDVQAICDVVLGVRP
jgi:CDP-6-deoxy-D-xylo-4-hexulose-3-dehydrase